MILTRVGGTNQRYPDRYTLHGGTVFVSIGAAAIVVGGIVDSLGNSTTREGVTLVKISLAGNLRPYQVECLQHLGPKPHVYIGDEMGLGKTIEAIALDAIRRHQGGPGKHKTLVVAPLTGVVDSWVQHFREWRPDLNVRRINAKKRHLLFKDSDDVDVFIIHPEGLRIMKDELVERRWLHLIFDEAHRIKNRKTKTSKATKEVGKQAAFKTLCSGTPMENTPDELWFPLTVLYPNKKARDAIGMPHWHQKLLSSYWRFFNRFVDWFEDEDGYVHIIGTKNEEELRSLLKPIYIRRLKTVVMKDLPPKITQEYFVDLTAKQRRAYDDMKKELLSWVGANEDQPVAANIVIAKLIRLQQFALAHGRMETGTITKRNGTVIQKRNMLLDEPSSKLDALMNIIDDLGDQQAIVFSTSRQMIDLAEKRMQAANPPITTSKITGKVPQHHRTGIIEAFQKGETQLFLATIRSGGVGLNLQNCSTVIFLDRDWVPGKNQQAIDRVHRSGQEADKVHIIDIIARNTIDTKKQRDIQRKWSWVKAVIGA